MATEGGLLSEWVSFLFLQKEQLRKTSRLSGLWPTLRSEVGPKF